MNFPTFVKIFGVVAILAGVGYKYAPSVWHTSKSAKFTADGKAVVAPKPGEMGEVTLTNHYETVVKISNGKNCTLVPHMIDSHNVELTVSLESRNAGGKTHDLAVTQVAARSGKLMEVALGGMQLTFTPKLVSAQ